MKKLLITLSSVLIILICSVDIFADDSLFNLGVEVQANDNEIIVEVGSDIATKKPTANINIPFDSAIVKYNGATVSSSSSNGIVSFVVENQGQYVITEGINIKFNSRHSKVKQIIHDSQTGNDSVSNELTLNEFVQFDKTDRFEFAVVADKNYSIESVKIGSTELERDSRNIDGTDYECFAFNVNGSNFVVDITYTGLATEFAADLANYKLAFYADSKDSIKDYAAKCIFDEFCVHGNNNDHAKYYGLFNSADDIKSKITLSDSTSTEGSIACDGNFLPYYTYTINGVSGFTGKIYTLSSASEFILRDGTTYKKVTVASGANVTTGVTVNRTNDYEVFGNGALDQGQSLLTDGQDTSFVEVRQIAPIKALSGTFSIGTSLIVYTNNFRGIYIKSDKIASPWDFANYPLYPLNNGATVNIFYANDSVEISAPEQSTNSTITDINFSNGTKEMHGSKIEENSGKYKVTFGSVFYDEVAINVTFTGGLTKRLTIKRVGIKILDNKIQNDKYKVFHGTDHSTEYDRKVDGSTCMISASFYYVDTNRVTLFARITNADGSITTKEIATPLNSLIGTASQGTHKSYDDFAIWEGLEKDKPRKVEVIAYVSGSGDTFGGVKLGSGAGVAWTR